MQNTNIKNYDSTLKNQFVSLIYACPFNEARDNCIFTAFRKQLNGEALGLVDLFSNNRIEQLLNKHEECFHERLQNKYLKKDLKVSKKQNNKRVYFQWAGVGNIDRLSAELKNRNWIKSQSEFVKFFDKGTPNTKVRWNMNYKYELAYLLFRLKHDNLIRVVNSKGYFSLAEQYFVDFSKKTLGENSLKRLSSKISTNPIKYKDVIVQVEEIISKIYNGKKNY